MATRKSTRLKSKPAITFTGLEPDVTVDEDAEFAEENLSDSDHEGPSRRKRNLKKVAAPSQSAGKNAKSVKGRRGRLRALPEMSLDILYEIFGHLRPYDVLRLARTTKALRGILMQRSAISVWKEARSNVEGLPDCPPDLTEPQYAMLAFDPFCHLCGAPNVHTVVWACRLRSCQKCINSECFMEPYDAGVRMQGIAVIAYGTLLPCATVRTGKYSRRRIVAAAQLSTVCETLMALRDDKTNLEKYVQERRDVAAAIGSHAALCEDWHRDTSIGRHGQLQDLKGRRKEAILTKLKELGWGEELEKNGQYTLHPLTTHALVKKPQELTDRIWSNIKQPLIEIMEELKEKRLRVERVAMLKKRQNVVVALLKTYVLERPITEVIPGPADVCDMEEFKTIIEDTSDDVEVDEETFKQAMFRLPHLVTEWRSAKDAELVRLINKDPASDGSRLNKSQPENDHTQLELAVIMFQCQICYAPISYPRILAHSCMRALRESYRDYEDTRSILWRNMDDEPWNFSGNRVAIDRRGKPTTRPVLISCGLDPDTTTANEMDDLDARFECLKCYDTTRGRLIMGWKAAVSHATKYHPNPDDAKWKLVDEVDTALVKLKEEEHLVFPTANYVCCARCRHKTYDYQISSHLKNEHEVEDVSKDDYYQPLDTPSPAVETRLLPDPREVQECSA